MKKAFFLDRDGVINKVIIKDGKAYSPRRFGEFEFMENVAEQIKKIKAAGYYIIVVTNQPDIARGEMDISELNKMTKSIKANLSVDEISICPHDDADNCTCRKPKPGMLVDEAKDLAVQAISTSIARDLATGDGVDVLVVTEKGTKYVFNKS